jgi:hypothetical protein
MHESVKRFYCFHATGVCTVWLLNAPYLAAERKTCVRKGVLMFRNLSKALTATIVTLAAAQSFAASIPPSSFPVKNGDSGQVYNMADHPNTVHVFESYGLNCVYCNQNAPAVDRLADEFKSNPRVRVMDLGVDRNDSDYAEWIRRHHPNHLVAQDVNRKVYNALHTENGIPQAFVVDCKGTMHGNIVGAWDSSAEQRIRQLIASALTVSCAQ